MGNLKIKQEFAVFEKWLSRKHSQVPLGGAPHLFDGNLLRSRVEYCK